MTNPNGRPPKFRTPRKLRAMFLEWKQKIETDEINDIPDIEAFCDYIGAWRDLLAEYEKKPQFSDTVKSIKNWIYYRKKQLAMQGKMNPAIFIFDAKNNAGYVDKTEVDNNLSGNVQFINEVPRPINN
jgi:hypothetical protein